MRLRGQTPNRARADTQLVRPRAQLPSAAVRVRPRASRTRRPPSVHAPPESPPRLPKQFTDTHTQSSVPSARYATAAPSSRRLSQPLRFGLARENTWALSRLRGAHLPRSVCNFRFRFGFGGTLFSLFRLRGAHLPRSVCNFRFGCGRRKHAAALAYPTHVTVSLLCVSSLPDLKGPCHRGAHPPWSLVGSARCAVPVRQFLTLSHLGAPSNPHPKPPAGHPSPRGRTPIWLARPDLSLSLPTGWLGQFSLISLGWTTTDHTPGVLHGGSDSPFEPAVHPTQSRRVKPPLHDQASRHLGPQCPSTGVLGAAPPTTRIRHATLTDARPPRGLRFRRLRAIPQRQSVSPVTPIDLPAAAANVCVCVPNARLAAYARSH